MDITERYRSMPLRDIIEELESLRAALAAVEAGLKALSAMLRRVEWSDKGPRPDDWEGEGYCPSCGSAEWMGHATDCELAALLVATPADGRE